MKQAKAIQSTAYHEAGHAVADMVLGLSCGIVSIVSDSETSGRENSVHTDQMTAEDIRKRIITLYAGAEAEKHVNQDHDDVRLGASGDDETARENLPLSESTEKALRNDAAQLLKKHWKLVESIAAELLRWRVLHGDEAELLYEIYQGNAKTEVLDNYRKSFADSLSQLPGRSS